MIKRDSDPSEESSWTEEQDWTPKAEEDYLSEFIRLNLPRTKAFGFVLSACCFALIAKGMPFHHLCVSKGGPCTCSV